MQLFVQFEVFDSIISKADINHLRKGVGSQVQVLQKSGKLVSSGIFTDGRHGFFIVELASAGDIWELLGGSFLDYCHITTHPVSSFDKLGKFFRKHPVK